MKSVKALKRQLVLAVVMMLISTFALCTATYAWYTNNNRVIAKGLSVVATTDGTSFEISRPMEDGSAPSGEDWPEGQVEETCVLESKPVYPTHPEIKPVYSALTPATWYHAYSEDYNDAAIDADQDEIDVDVADNALSLKSNRDMEYALVATFYVRLNPITSGGNSTVDNIKAGQVTISYPENATDLMKSVRILVAGPDGAEVLKDGDELGTVDIVKTLKSSEEPQKIDVYVFFEGTDENCKSSLYDTKAVSVSLGFIGTINSN